MCSVEVHFFSQIFYSQLLDSWVTTWLSGLLPGNELSHVSGAVRDTGGLPILLLFHFSHDVSFNHIELIFYIVWARMQFLLRWVGNETTPLIRPIPFSWGIKMPPSPSPWHWTHSDLFLPHCPSVRKPGPFGQREKLATCTSQDSVQNVKSTQFRGTVPPSIASGYKAQLPIRTGASPENGAGRTARRVRVLALPED